jgi:hypothetical protein
MTRFFLSVFALAISVSLRADDLTIVAEVRAADDLRVAAMMAGNASDLDATLSEKLHYAHSADGFVQDKTQHIDSLVSRHLIYRRFDFKTRDFSIVAPGVVLSKGRALVEVGSTRMIFLVDINFLAVWRLENQRWKLFAWQSSRNAEIVPLGPILEKQPNSASEPTGSSGSGSL